LSLSFCLTIVQTIRSLRLVPLCQKKHFVAKATFDAALREAASLHRTAMTQPGVYFALDVPFVRVLGLFSNALADPALSQVREATGPVCRIPAPFT
jgi:hypothetical protein